MKDNEARKSIKQATDIISELNTSRQATSEKLEALIKCLEDGKLISRFYGPMFFPKLIDEKIDAIMRYLGIEIQYEPEIKGKYKAIKIAAENTNKKSVGSKHTNP